MVVVKRRCVFLDRDGVINTRPRPHEYVCSWADFVLIPQVVDWIRFFNTLDLLVIVVTNQRCVARGLMSREDLDHLHGLMRDLLAARGARIDDVFACPHEIGTCECRKPLPGLILQARKKWNIDLTASLLIGDSHSDEQLASNAGLRFIPVRDGRVIDRLAEEATGEV